MSRRAPVPVGSGAAFTLTELLIVVAVIAVLSTLTLIGVRTVARDARVSSGVNTVTASLDTARALAMKSNRPVLVAFYPRAEGNRTRTDVITAAWTGDSVLARVDYPGAPDKLAVFDRFRPVPEVPPRALPAGIKVAGPSWEDELNEQWLVMTELGRPGEAPGRLVGVLFGADGATLADNPANQSDFFFIDFNGSENLELDGNGDGAVDPADPADRVLAAANQPVWHLDFQRLRHAHDEVAIHVVPFLAVFDDDEARELHRDGQWADPATRRADLSRFIAERGNRVHFNRYTGVPMQ